VSGPARQQIKKEHVRKELLENQSVQLLQELHLLTREGQLNADARRKLKQVNHLVGLLQPALEASSASDGPTIVDVGSGNSYLGFVLYELFLKVSGRVVSVESRPELVEKSKARAQKLGFSRMEFVEGAISKAQVPTEIQVLTALHACDTATDDALVAGIRAKANYIALVPCCQAEVAQLLKDARGEVSRPLKALFAHAWHRREFGSHLTNVIRALLLESFGYQVTVTELTGWEHSLKNEFILAKLVGFENREAKARLEELLNSIHVRPKAVRVLLDGLAH
jgi:SAM-dependent methyltransferase